MYTAATEDPFGVGRAHALEISNSVTFGELAQPNRRIVSRSPRPIETLMRPS
jgi:hypothetical protein